ncbi:2Fe-2S iron-sulfur cluster-binding protein [Dietzia cinnamea]|uniref:2Fe-2S iron-sulfur cluster-binding protein n=2 Tax=Dietzia TaxID=37914 RepID=UPI000782FB6A|nr:MULTISPECIES: 2Fe-2S iron-sulfur cluster binding domain-containing protein [Dietzia]MCT2059816.1 2Fe-2S iron-sulfur cluster binding domain-containing protein [Dietzia cinnamea]MCT2121963.1 2Fe-2S iron-sulfur cluster binding domain-containing protein [Dietzia cinnamea]MCT2146088.1 2Fe-2S iron-sulfur cluster binding domain-containing protein [Dietzia cinnamea]MCT2305407.1 2Fe-2S iron-sulfur cluster binding domain-containing protein [Dietzia cinnamea]
MAAPHDEPFEIELCRSGEVLTVPADRTALSVLFEARQGLDSDCLRGECGACVQTLLSGTPDHRDTVLSPRARAAGRRFIPCVSRAYGGRLVLDL